MQTDFVQRWREGREHYRPARETIRASAYDVAEMAEDALAKSFVTSHHYTHTYPAARFRFGLFRLGRLAGVAVFSHPCSDKVLTRTFPDLTTREAVELGRFVLTDDVEANGETWFLARCFAALRGRVRGVVSFSDPVRRTTANGDAFFGGHVGTIYQASNATYLGRATARTLMLLPDGRCFSARAAQKIRAGERGWRYAAAQLEAFGADVAPEDSEGRLAWLRAWSAVLLRPLAHSGNYRYAWRLDRASIPGGLAYPKKGDYRLN